MAHWKQHDLTNLNAVKHVTMQKVLDSYTIPKVQDLIGMSLF